MNFGAFADRNYKILRGGLTRENTPPTLDTYRLLPAALEAVWRLIGSDWHRNFSPTRSRLDDEYRSSPLNLVGTVRLEPKKKLVPKFARALQVTEDYLNKRDDFDHFFGGLAIQQIFALGNVLSRVEKLEGDVTGKIAELTRSKGNDPDKAIYELLVAGAFVAAGMSAEFLKPTQQKTPDLRIGGVKSDLRIECKRRSELLQYEEIEARKLEESFVVIRKELIPRRAGIFEATFKVPLEKLQTREIVEASLIAVKQNTQVFRSWGSIGFTGLENESRIEPTRLYSANYLEEVFGWSCDLPKFDGIICQSATPPTFVVGKAVQPIALKWVSTSHEAMVKKSRGVNSLIGDAIMQFPDKTLGVPYICYLESARAEVADARTEAIQKELKDIYHPAQFLMPAVIINRLYPQSTRHGDPDLIENGIEMYAEYIPETQRGSFPVNVFTAADSET